MRYYGCKNRLLDFLEIGVAKTGINHGSNFCDLFSGTTTVARYFKEKGYTVIANDILEFSYALARAYIKNNRYPLFKGLKGKIEGINGSVENISRIVDYLNNLRPLEGFIYKNYCPGGTKNSQYQRQYFSNENGKKIDAIRSRIQEWKDKKLICDDEFYILLTSLIESVSRVANISGTYGAFLKWWDQRALKPLILKTPDIIISSAEHKVYREDANKLIRKIKCDILYLDPPYNTRQYATNYHILETIARWDNPGAYGKTGLRPYEDLKSNYCNKDKCTDALKDLIENASCSHILFSYNNEGIIPREQIVKIMSQKGKLKIYERSYRRFRSDSDNEKRSYSTDRVTEILYFIKVG